MTHEQFVTALCGRFRDGFTAPATALLGYAPATEWPDAPAVLKPDVAKFRVRVFERTAKEVQAAFGAVGGSRLFEARGTWYAQIYGPAAHADTPRLLASLAEIAAGLYRGVSEPNGVWYRDTTIQSQAVLNSMASKRVGGTFTYNRTA